MTREEVKQVINHQLREEEDRKALIFFTDGSVIPDKGNGVAAVTKDFTFTIKIGPLGGVSNYETEITGISLDLFNAPNILATTEHLSHISIFSDSQAAIQLSHKSPTARTGQHLALQIRNLVEKTIPITPIKFFWTPGHQDIDLNDQADEAAKGAALSSNNELLLPRSLDSICFLINLLTVQPEADTV